jgi:hypothetical protein
VNVLARIMQKFLKGAPPPRQELQQELIPPKVSMQPPELAQATVAQWMDHKAARPSVEFHWRWAGVDEQDNSAYVLVCGLGRQHLGNTVIALGTGDTPELAFNAAVGQIEMTILDWRDA